MSESENIIIFHQIRVQSIEENNGRRTRKTGKTGRTGGRLIRFIIVLRKKFPNNCKVKL